MTRIDFYVLAGSSPQGRAALACRLAEKAYGFGHAVYVHVESDSQARAMDEILWTFRENSFLPHEIHAGDESSAAPIQIGCVEDPQVDHDVLINLSPDVPVFFSRFERMAELVDSDPQVRERSRRRFRYYKERGYPLTTHKLR